MESATQNEQQRTSVRELQVPSHREAMMPAVSPGFNSLQSYELMVRQARMLANSTLVPEQYREVVVKYNRDGTIKSSVPNPNGLANCAIALNMAQRMNADPIMVMQNLVLVEGRPSWSSQWVIAQINNSGRFEPLRFDLKHLGSKTVKFEYSEWDDQQNRKVKKSRDVVIDDMECTAWTVRKGVVIPLGVNSIEEALAAKLPILKGPKVTVEIAVKEGWYTKNGSKWQTMPELMIHYRSGAFFGRLYAPDLLMGIPSQDEMEDMRVPTVLSANSDGSYGVGEPAPGPGQGDGASGEPAAPPPPAAAGAEAAGAQEPAQAPQQQPQGDATGNENTGQATGDAPAAGPAASDDMFGKVN